MATFNLPQVKYDLIRLSGGLDLVTPTLSLKPGVVRDSLNFESSITGGYSRISGYERYDGRTSPSSASYSELTINISATISVNNTIVGATSGATGVVIDVTGSVVSITKQTGTFQVGENVRVSGVVKGSVTALSGSATTVQRAALLTSKAADVYRSDIGAVPGSGSIRGVAYFNNTLFAWRDNSAGTEMLLYRATSSGWTAVNLGKQLSFSSGSREILEGMTILGHTSGATGLVSRVVLESGAWSSGTAAGRLIFSSTTGTFATTDDLRIGILKYAEADSTQTNITLLPGGRIDFDIGTFGASSATRIYGCDGVNRAFEFDGTVYVPIHTGMAVDVPNHIAVHKQHLFLSYDSSLQFSAIGDPYVWDPVVGAGEIAMPESITLFVIQPGDQSSGAMAVYSDSNTSILYGSSEADFRLVTYNVGTGAKAFSGQNISQTYTFDNRGVISLQTSLNFGNFDSAAMTLNIRPFTQQRRNLVTTSGVSREKGQYRVFFSDGYGLYLTFVNGQYVGAMPVQFPNPVSCMCEGRLPDGSETSFFGSTNGYVYGLDTGTSFDGQDITANMTLVFNSIGSPRILKKYRRGSLEITGNGYAAFEFSYDLGYGSTEYMQPGSTSYETSLQASFWDSISWDSFVWDGRTLAPSEVELEGSAENIAIRLTSSANYYQPFTINSAIVHFSTRRGLR